MKYQSLNGEWNYRIGKGKFEKVNVPFSHLPVGHSECECTFNIEQNSPHIFLEFLGITYEAKVYLNGEFLGKMLPYSEYRFEISNCVKEKDNFLHVELEDIAPKFGPTEGWENFGGIIRDVSVIYADEFYFEDVFFSAKLLNDYRDAVMNVQIKATQNKECKVRLLFGDAEVVCCTQCANVEAKQTEVKDVKLWSPDTPNLYTLEVSAEGEIYRCNVGFREITCDKHCILLNGKPCYIHGVCKHEMIGDSGHCPSIEQMEHDMQMIKDAGCNFVRLVHYPHNKKIVDIADKIGLMISEEPGLWWSDTSDPEIAEGSIEVLKRVILRDRNHPSVAFWLSFNECRFTEEFLVNSAKVCKEYDPTRLVSGANCMNFKDTKKYYNICGFDFYTMHPYANTFDLAQSAAEYLNDKPLIFTEWGGYPLYNNPHLLKDFLTSMKNLFFNRSDKAALAGACFWEWSELNDFNRGKPACVDGVLKEGLTDKYRNPTLIFDAFCEMGKYQGEPDKASLYEYKGLTDFAGNAIGGHGGAAFEDAVKIIDTPLPSYYIAMRPRYTTVGPKLQREEIAGINKTPFVCAKDAPVVFDVNRNADNLYLIGGVSFTYGYPIIGEYGEAVMQATITYIDGKQQKIILKNGVDITTVLSTIGSSRINPTAENAILFAKFSYEKNHENYQINLITIKPECREDIKSVVFENLNENYNVLIYGLFC